MKSSMNLFFYLTSRLQYCCKDGTNLGGAFFFLFRLLIPRLVLRLASLSREQCSFFLSLSSMDNLTVKQMNGWTDRRIDR